MSIRIHQTNISNFNQFVWKHISYLSMCSIQSLTKIKRSLANIAASLQNSFQQTFTMQMSFAASLRPPCGKPQLHYLNGCRKFQKTCCGDVLANFWRCSGELLAMFWRTFGNVLANFWQCSGELFLSII